MRLRGRNPAERGEQGKCGYRGVSELHDRFSQEEMNAMTIRTRRRGGVPSAREMLDGC
jgi:hypothetical protein